MLPTWTTRDLLTPLFRHKGGVVGVRGGACPFGLCGVGRGGALLRCSMQIVVQQHRSDPSISAGQTGAIMNTSRGLSPDQISSEMAILKGDDMLRSVAATCGLTNSDGFSLSELFYPRDPERHKAAKFEKAASSLGKGLKVEAAKVSDVIAVRYGVVGVRSTSVRPAKPRQVIFAKRAITAAAGFFCSS